MAKKRGRIIGASGGSGSAVTGVNALKLRQFHDALSRPGGITRGDAKRLFGWRNDATFSRKLAKVKQVFPVTIERPPRGKGLRGDDSVWSCSRPPSIPVSLPTETAAIFAHLCAEFGHAMLGTAGRNLAKFVEEINRSLPEEVRGELEALRDRVRFFFRQVNAGTTGIFGTLVTAITSNRVVEMEYESARAARVALASRPALPEPVAPLVAVSIGKARKKEARPRYQVLGIYFAKRALYAIVREHGRHDEQSLDGLWSARLDRIKSLAIRGDTFTPPDGFKVSEYMSSAWEAFRVHPPKPVEVRIRVDPEVHVNIANTTWHPSQVYEFEDGKHFYIFHLDGFDELKYWVLHLGPGAEVISPPECRAEMAKLIAGMSAAYNGVTAATPSAGVRRRKRGGAPVARPGGSKR